MESPHSKAFSQAVFQSLVSWFSSSSFLTRVLKNAVGIFKVEGDTGAENVDESKALVLNTLDD